MVTRRAFVRNLAAALLGASVWGEVLRPAPQTIATALTKLRLDWELTQIALAFEPTGFIADRIFPVIPGVPILKEPHGLGYLIRNSVA